MDRRPTEVGPTSGRPAEMAVGTDAPMAVMWASPCGLPPLVEGVWEQRALASPRWCIFPTGRIQLIFNLGLPFEVRDARRRDDLVTSVARFAFLSGLHTGPLNLGLHGLHVFGVQLHPVASMALFGLPCDVLLDGAVPGDEVVRDLERIEDRLLAARDFATRVEWILDELRTWAARARDLERAERVRRMAVDLPGDRPRSTRELDRMLGFSRSHAHRHFRTWLGQPAGDVVRLARFVRSVAAVHAGDTSLTAIAHDLGYADQAHFTRSFRAFAGMTPSAYRRSMGPLLGQFAP